MPEGTERGKRHFILAGSAETELFVSPRRVVKREPVLPRDRASHSAALLRQLADAASARASAETPAADAGVDLQLEFESFPGIEMAFESLAREQRGIELLNVRHADDRTLATVFVPDGKLAHFEQLVREYLAERRDSRGRRLDHQRLVDSIREIRAATLRALWTDDLALFPNADDAPIWWEVWLPVRGNRASALSAFRERARAIDIRIARGEVIFPERTVLLVYASPEQLRRSVAMLNSIAELRRAKETAEFFDSLSTADQGAWVQELLTRTQFANASDQAPAVCLLDTGVNHAHPLIAPALDVADLHTVEPAWGVNDDHHHGTEMAGLALHGDLTEQLADSGVVEIRHRLESVKLLRTSPVPGGDAENHGYLTAEAVSRPEITAPTRRRVFGLATTARDNRDRGRPTAWSAAIDRLTSDADNFGANPRLMVISAGNIDTPSTWLEYPASNDTDGAHDPAQAWNALTVGAFTNFVRITDPDSAGYQPIAAAGALSPFSTTSRTWSKEWPLKPDVVLEGGNAAVTHLHATPYAETKSSLSLLTTHYQPATRLLTTSNATSAAAALCTRMAAQLMAEYPELWAETIRALVVQSAEWSPAMLETLGGSELKRDIVGLVRRCGFGIPDLQRAQWSVSNSLSMIVQERLHPFHREKGGDPKLRDMHLHTLPWPRDVLESLGEVQVEMRVTLSYFIEPNPSARGRSRYRYESHGLRFDVIRPQESVADFRSRINAAARDEEEGTPSGGGDDPYWVLGKQNRHRGSLHADIWRGTAADLASRGILAIYPALGWWKTRPRLARFEQAARYSLIVSIRAPEIEVDLYTAVANKIGIPIAVET